jgi:simple sugar transport system substrate-binding protein
MKGVARMLSTLLKSPTANPKRGRLSLAAAAVVGVASLVLAGCTAGGSPDDNSTDSTSGGGEGITVAIMGGAPDDPFWSTVKRGAEAAAKAVEAAGGTVTFVSMPNYDNFNADAAKLVANIEALDPDAVIVPNWVPDAQNDNISSITSKGIPVIIYNAGQDTVEAVGAQTYIGSDDYTAGVAGGQAFADAGAKNIVCVNTLPGAVNTEARCQGILDGATDAGSTSSSLNLPTTQFGDPSAVTQAIKGALIDDPTIDALVTIATTDSDSAAAAIDQAGAAATVKLGTFDVSTSGLERIQAGTQLFSIDQQPYAQGYYAVSYAFQLAAYGIYLPQSPLLTGPALINADNVDIVIKGTELGVR